MQIYSFEPGRSIEEIDNSDAYYRWISVIRDVKIEIGKLVSEIQYSCPNLHVRVSFSTKEILDQEGLEFEIKLHSKVGDVPAELSLYNSGRSVKSLTDFSLFGSDAFRMACKFSRSLTEMAEEDYLIRSEMRSDDEGSTL